MLFLDKDFKKEMGNRNVSIQELADYLVRNNNVYDIAMELAERIVREREYQPAPKIVVTEEEYHSIISLFRVKGFTASGEKSYKGRPPKTEKGE